MATNKNDASLFRRLREEGKFYSFDRAHDPTLPAQLWFQESTEGEILFVVFYTQACRWSRCLGCNLPSRMSKEPVSFEAIVAQIDHLFADRRVLARRGTIRKMIISNNGSILDQETFPTTALMYLLVRIKLHLPRLELLCMESRVEFVEPHELEFMARALGEGERKVGLEIGVGFEAFDDRIRNRVFRKGLARKSFERFIKKLARHGFQAKCYFMQKPVPGMSDPQAIEDIRHAIDYLGELAGRYRLPLNIHLNPTFVASGTPLETFFRQGAYTPPRLRHVAFSALHARGKPLSVFIGLNDEGLAAEGGSFLREGEEEVVRDLEMFNRTQDFGILEKIAEPA